VAHILVVDDDANIRELVAHFLAREGFDITQAEDGIAALAAMDKRPAELVVLDIMMPRMDGWSLCEKLREQFDIPLLMLTAKGETSQKVRGFRIGADDYLVKPFEPDELVARVKALLKRYKISISRQVSCGRIVLNRDAFAVETPQGRCTLPLKEFELLFKLASYPGMTFAREQLIEQIWGYDYEGDERTVDVHIKRLRERFNEDQHGFRITTIRGLGYRLEAIV